MRARTRRDRLEPEQSLFWLMTKGLLVSLAWVVAEDLSGPECVGQVSPSPGVEEAEDRRQLGAPSKESDGEGACVQRDLGRDQDEPLQERAKFHVKDA